MNGTLYGTTTNGGAGNCADGCGTVFSITPTGKYHLLYSFAAGHDGEYPYSGLIDVNGKLYGTTFGGGRRGVGTVFSITTSGSEKVLHAFTASDGKYPQAGLINVNGKLFGTTQSGTHSHGTIFSITTTGTEKVLHRFGGGSDGAYPYAVLINVNGTLFGTTQSGGGAGCGSGGCGTVYSVTTTGAETVLHAFKGGATDGAYPQAGLINSNGTLYGTTGTGGANGDGTVYTITGY
ncbi:MAG: choice-of-anchor tandem repeat GloVer-containing protein [Candidatus Cybelea sp.]